MKLQDTIKAIKEDIRYNEDYQLGKFLSKQGVDKYIDQAVSATLTAVKEGIPKRATTLHALDAEANGFNSCRSEVLDMLDKL